VTPRARGRSSKCRCCTADLDRADVLAGITASLAVGSTSPDVVALEARKAADRRGAPAGADSADDGGRVVILAEHRSAAVLTDERPLLARQIRHSARAGNLVTRRRNVTEQAATAAIEQGAAACCACPPSATGSPRSPPPSATNLTYLGLLSELVIAECDDRARRRAERRIRAAGFPRPKRLEEFSFEANPAINPAVIGQLASCAWVKAGHPLCLIGDRAPAKATYSSRWALWPPKPDTESATPWPASWSTNLSKQPTISS
jgi:hypothetical protein